MRGLQLRDLLIGVSISSSPLCRSYSRSAPLPTLLAPPVLCLILIIAEGRAEADSMGFRRGSQLVVPLLNGDLLFGLGHAFLRVGYF
jgi:hypothetical protein